MAIDKQAIAAKLLAMLDEYCDEAAEHEDESHAAKLSVDDRIKDFITYQAAALDLI